MSTSERDVVVAVAQRGHRVVVTVHLNGGGRRRVTYARQRWRALVEERGGADCVLGRPVALDGDRLFFLDPDVLSLTGPYQRRSAPRPHGVHIPNAPRALPAVASVPTASSKALPIAPC